MSDYPTLHLDTYYIAVLHFTVTVGSSIISSYLKMNVKRHYVCSMEWSRLHCSQFYLRIELDDQQFHQYKTNKYLSPQIVGTNG